MTTTSRRTVSTDRLGWRRGLDSLATAAAAWDVKGFFAPHTQKVNHTRRLVRKVSVVWSRWTSRVRMRRGI
jgi:hypothetical protein